MVFIRDAVKMRRRMWWSLPVKIEGDPLNTQEEKEEVDVVFTRENKGGSTQHATRATPTRSSHGAMRAQPCAIPIYSSAVEGGGGGGGGLYP